MVIMIILFTKEGRSDLEYLGHNSRYQQQYLFEGRFGQVQGGVCLSAHAG